MGTAFLHDHEKSHAVGALWENREARTRPSSDRIHTSAVSLQPQGLLYHWSLVEGGVASAGLWAPPSVPVCSRPPASGLRGGASVPAAVPLLHLTLIL